MPVIENKLYAKLKFPLDSRILSVLLFSLFSGWLLAFPFEGQIFYALGNKNNIDIHNLLFSGIFAHFIGLFTCGLFVKNIHTAKRTFTFSTVLCIAGSTIFFSRYSIMWHISIILISLSAGFVIASWGFYLKNFTPSNERIKTVADALILSNIIMIIFNVVAINISPYISLAISILALFFALILNHNLNIGMPTNHQSSHENLVMEEKVIFPLLFLCIFIIIITINSGLMYRIINPAFGHHQFLVSWYWSIPYITTIFILRNLPLKTNRTYALTIGIAMIGFSFLLFAYLDRSALSYIIIDSLMLGACGIFDLFWWSILAEMLDYSNNAAKIFGIGLSANVLGVFIGELIGSAIYTVNFDKYDPTLIAFIVVFIIMLMLPILNNQLLKLLKTHAFLTKFFNMDTHEQNGAIYNFMESRKLTEREKEITVLLLKGLTYKMIANELCLSENTIKTHIKNIYSKFDVKSKSELMIIFNETNIIS
ncbi:helix-turn-helix transcriptional regulator [Tepidanaerobacter sp. EBM-38]|uniref:response regulator transcription factor n=1 Tax=Tepidanaerobacter sp. EBM-38 TaxID=1918496 RepID=UPI000B010C68|nr:helix-turn-helix transcriptional regulator [Tepidanaerobacter sp. EBM-38]